MTKGEKFGWCYQVKSVSHPTDSYLCRLVTMRLCPQTSSVSELMMEKNAISNQYPIHSKMKNNNDNENLLRQLIEAENSHDVERLVSLLTDDVVIENIPLGVVMKGKDGVRQEIGRAHV